MNPSSSGHEEYDPDVRTIEQRVHLYSPSPADMHSEDDDDMDSEYHPATDGDDSQLDLDDLEAGEFHGQYKEHVFTVLRFELASIVQELADACVSHRVTDAEENLGEVEIAFEMAATDDDVTTDTNGEQTETETETQRPATTNTVHGENHWTTTLPRNRPLYSTI